MKTEKKHSNGRVLPVLLLLLLIPLSLLAGIWLYRSVLPAHRAERNIQDYAEFDERLSSLEQPYQGIEELTQEQRMYLLDQAELLVEELQDRGKVSAWNREGDSLCIVFRGGLVCFYTASESDTFSGADFASIESASSNPRMDLQLVPAEEKTPSQGILVLEPVRNDIDVALAHELTKIDLKELGERYLPLVDCVYPSLQAQWISQQLPYFRYSSNDVYSDSMVTIEAFKNLGRYGIVLFEGHGAYNATLNKGPVLCSGQNATRALMHTYAEDIEAGNVILTRTILVAPTLSVGPGFFRKYIANMEGSFVYLGACYSCASDALANVFMEKGARGVMGYSNSIEKGLEMVERVYYLERLARNESTPGRVTSEELRYGSGLLKLYSAEGDSFTLWQNKLALNITDENEMPLEGVSAVLACEVNSSEKAFLTDSDGRVDALLPRGEYTVTLRKKGYRTVVSEPYRVDKNKTMMVSIVMEKAPADEGYLCTEERLVEGSYQDTIENPGAQNILCNESYHYSAQNGGQNVIREISSQDYVWGDGSISTSQDSFDFAAGSWLLTQRKSIDDSIQWTYDEYGRLTEKLTNGDEKDLYFYNDDGSISVQQYSSAFDGFCGEETYDISGRLTHKWYYTNGYARCEKEYFYDEQGRLVQIVGKSYNDITDPEEIRKHLKGQSWEYSGLPEESGGSTVTKISILEYTSTETYEYQNGAVQPAIYRCLSVYSSGELLSDETHYYTYDANGNCTADEQNSLNRYYYYDELDNCIARELCVQDNNGDWSYLTTLFTYVSQTELLGSSCGADFRFLNEELRTDNLERGY